MKQRYGIKDRSVVVIFCDVPAANQVVNTPTLIQVSKAEIQA